ncbi:hypothetical protein [Kitasatospora sp. NPDC058046]|uniref:hypothetical protein n=1 Tax=Kitasatospora sp. NPDC058046 TaxID=3346312 RepID=UPI0036D9FAAA
MRLAVPFTCNRTDPPVTASSPAFADPVALALLSENLYVGVARVADGTKPGSYPVTVRYLDQEIATATLTVTDSGPIAAGGGWAARQAAVLGSSHPGLALTAYGTLGLVAAASGLRVIKSTRNKRAHPNSE